MTLFLKHRISQPLRTHCREAKWKAGQYKKLVQQNKVIAAEMAGNSQILDIF